MGTFFTAILAFFGGVTGLWGFIGLLGVIVLAVILTSAFKGKNNSTLQTIEHLAGTAVQAVEKLANNGQFDNMTVDQRHAAKKAAALDIISNGLKAQGITPNPALMSFAGFAIEAVLNAFDKQQPAPAPAPASDTGTTTPTTN